MKFKAKPDFENFDVIIGEKIEPFDGFNELVDDDGYIRGYYVDGYIVGKVADATDEYFNPEFWCPIDKSTLAAIGGGDEKTRN